MDDAGFYINIARLHPLIVHLPIGILLFAFLLELVKRWKRRDELAFAVRLALIAGAASSVLAVVTGLLLADEGGYPEGAVNWHRWSGIALAVVSLLAVFLYNSPRQRFRKLVMPAQLLIVVLLMLTGHFGGNMTHGEDYLFTKVVEEESWEGDVAEAMLYQDIVAPILSAKCNSCHNPSKSKGDLIMTNTASLFAGGRSGVVIDLNKPAASELLRRLHLPLSDKKHMPPRGKQPLATEEIELLKWWIDQQACTDCKVVDVTAGEDILGILAEKFVKDPFEDIVPPSAEVMADLESKGIKVRPVAEDHPMVIVNLSFRQDLDAKTLDLLDPVAGNVLELDLSGSNFTDLLADRLEGLENLRILKLQRTAVSDQVIKAIDKLEHLEVFNIYQTNVTDAVLPSLLKMKSLRKLYAWNSKVTAEAVAQLETERPDLSVQLEVNPAIFGKSKVSMPEIHASSPFFAEEANLELHTEMDGAQIFYTLDSTLPDSNSLLYSKPLLLKETSEVSAIAVKAGWAPSEVARLTLLQTKTIPAGISLVHPPAGNYQAQGAPTLIDRVKASAQFTDGQWLGFQSEDMIATLQLPEKQSFQNIWVSALADQNSWIFFPTQIVVSTSVDGTQYEEAGRIEMPLTQPEELVSAMTYFKIPLSMDRPARFVRVQAANQGVNPPWHPSPGKKSWLFVDEILLE